MIDEKTKMRLAQMDAVHEELRSTFAVKNTDYGDSFSEYGPVGVLIRMGDKVKRLVSVTKNGVVLVDGESLRDTAMDLANYATMLVMLLDEVGGNG